MATDLTKILIVQTGFLGDLILSTPVISALRKIYPKAKIDVLCTKQAVSLIADHPEVSKAIPFDKRKLDSGFFGVIRKAKELRSNKYDAVFSLHKSLRTSFLLLFSGIPLRYGFKESSFAFLYTKTSRRKDLSHDVLRNLAILRNIDLNPEEIAEPMSLGLPAESKEQVSDLLSNLDLPFIAIAPGSVWKTKRWTPEGFAELACQILKSGKGVALIGGPDDKPSGDFIESEILKLGSSKEKNFINTIGKLDLITSATLISRSETLVCNDSAPLHMASALNIPVVSIFCATVPEFGFTPWMVPHRIVEKKGMSCRPCGRHGSNSCPLGTNACQIEITPHEVLNAIKDLHKELGL